MQINPITTESIAQASRSASTAVQSDQQVKAVAITNDQSPNKPAKLDSVETNDPNKVSSDNKQSPSAVENQKKPERAISHVVETYNQYGAVRTKFLDSRNNVIYQTPTEMLAKMEDLMGKPETSTDIKS